MDYLINVTAVREFIYGKVKTMRPGWDMTCISKEALDIIDAKLRYTIIQMIQSHPTLGKTFKP